MKFFIAKFLAVLIFIINYQLTTAANYYLSASGNDTKSGLTPTDAWKTISHLNSQINNFTPGTHIFFNRGDKFSGQIDLNISGTATAKIYFEAYGIGINPIIDGCVSTNMWTNYSANIWKTEITNGSIQQVFENNKRLLAARYPDTGFLRMDLAAGNTGFIDAALNQSVGYFNGCNVIMQNIDWAWEYRKVLSSSAAGAISFAPTDYITENDVGYFFNNKLAFVTREGEWYFDTSTKFLYMYSLVNPTSKSITASVFEYGIKCDWNTQNIVITDLNFLGQSKTAIWYRGASASNLSITSCKFFNQYNFGAELMGDSIKVINCTFENIGGTAIDGFTITNFKFSNNRFLKIGVEPGVGNGGTGSFQAIKIWEGNNATVSNNIIDSTGYCGITINASNGLIEKNIINNTLLTTSDGGALYSWSSSAHHNVYKKNIISNVKGNVTARPAGTYKIVNALYMDNYVYNVLLTENVIYNVEGNGIVINAGAHDNVIEKNTTYTCNAGICFSDWLAGNTVYNNRMHHNIFYANKNNSISILVQSNDNNYNVLAESDSNYLCNPFAAEVAHYEWSTPQNFTLAQWRSFTTHDMHSKQSFYTWVFPGDSSMLIVNKGNNDTLHTFSSAVSLDNIVVDSIVLTPFTSQIVILKKSAVVYTFNGNGNWSNPSNWVLNKIPATTLSPGAEIIIDPFINGECLLDLERYLPAGTKLTVAPGKKLNIKGNFILQ